MSERYAVLTDPQGVDEAPETVTEKRRAAIGLVRGVDRSRHADTAEFL